MNVEEHPMITYYQARRTPDGPMVTRHDPPDFEGVALPDADYDWGDSTDGAYYLAADLMFDATGIEPTLYERDRFFSKVVCELPREGWRMTWPELWAMNQQPDEHPF